MEIITTEIEGEDECCLTLWCMGERGRRVKDRKRAYSIVLVAIWEFFHLSSPNSWERHRVLARIANLSIDLDRAYDEGSLKR
jgi:hypothetical protein